MIFPLFRWLKTSIKIISIILISLILLSISLLFVLTGTDKGFHFLLNSASEMSSQAFTFSKVSGNLLHKLKIKNFKYSDESIQLEIKQFYFNWIPISLLDLNFNIESIKADGLSFKQLHTNESMENSTTLKLPEIILPVNINLTQIQISDIDISLAPEAEIIHIDSIELQADLINSQVNLHHLKLSMPEARANIDGSISLLENYPLSLQNNISLTLTDQPELIINGKIRGNLTHIDIKQQLKGILDASIEATINDLLSQLVWQADILIETFDLAPYLASSSLVGDNKAENVNTSAQIKLNGDLQQAEIILTTQILDGTIDINSHVSWIDGINWQTQLQTQKINPGILHQEWPGSLNIDLQSTGSLVNEKVQARLMLNNISGQLRQKPISGGGEFDINNQHITINTFYLSSADAKITAHGKLEDKLDLSWSLAISKLSDLLPDAQGSIKGQGTIKGTTLQPILNADVKLEHINYKTIKLNNADLKCTLHSNPGISSQLELTVQTLKVDKQNIEKIFLSFNGPLEKHQIKLMIDHELANLSLQADGKFDPQQQSWDGTLSQLLIDSTEFGLWRQSKSSTIFGSAEKIIVSPLCLHEQNTSLCSQLNWTTEKGDIKLTLKDLSFDKAKAYLPEEISKFTGGIALTAHIDIAPELLAKIKINIQPGELVFQQTGLQAITMAHKNGLIEAEYNRQNLISKWNIEIGPHSIGGHLSLPRKSLEKDPMTAAMDGNIKIDITELSLISVFLPIISELNGHIFADLKLTGSPGEPRIDGKAEVIADTLTIDDLGLHIKNIRLNILGEHGGNSLALTGGLQSGEGQLQLEGLISLDKKHGFPVQFEIQGENFLALNTPDAYAVISPDIKFAQQNGLMEIKGKVIIPEATIAPSTILEGSVSTSDDIIILGSEEKTPANLGLDIIIELGDKIKLDVFGLKSDVTGALTIKQVPKHLMTANGELHLNNGTFRAYGQDLNISEGIIFYAGGYLDNPGIKLTAVCKVSEVEVGLKVSGSAKKPKIIAFSDDPTLKEKDIVSMMLTGQKTDNLDKASVYAGTNLNEDLSVGVNAGMGDEATEFIIRYKLTDSIELEGTSSSEKSGGGIFYTFELD